MNESGLVRREPTFDRLANAVRAVAHLEGYRDAHVTEIDEAAKEMRAAFTEFARLPAVKEQWGEERCETAARLLDEDTRKCTNCGEVDCENPDCEDG